jgi:hypothetical protein
MDVSYFSSVMYLTNVPYPEQTLQKLLSFVSVTCQIYEKKYHTTSLVIICEMHAAFKLFCNPAGRGPTVRSTQKNFKHSSKSFIILMRLSSVTTAFAKHAHYYTEKSPGRCLPSKPVLPLPKALNHRHIRVKV